MKLYAHQENFLKENPDKALVCFEAGTGKSFMAVQWLKTRNGNALIVVPKQIKKTWQEAVSHLNVVTKEEFKKLSFTGAPSALVLDEAHFASAPLFTPQRSQIAEKVYNLIKMYPNMPVLLLTATPISSTPANLHTLLCFIGVYIPWQKWRDHFYTLQKLPYLPRVAYLPRSDWRKRIQPFLVKHAHIALMSDIIDDLPPITETVVKIDSKPFQALSYEPMAAFVEEHRHEQKDKVKEIKRIGAEYRKVIVVAHFREQIEQLYKELSKDRQTYVLHGGINDQGKVIQEAQEDFECYFIIQSSIGAGFDADSFSVMIFASMSYSYRSFVQMKARIRRIHALKPVQYFYLQGGRCDRGIYKHLLMGKDFDPVEFTKYAPQSAKKI